MFKKILVPVQTEVNDQAVIDSALNLAQQLQGQIMFLHVFSSEDKGRPLTPTPVLYNYPMVTDELMKNYRSRLEDAESQGLEMLKRLTAKAASMGISAEFTQNIGTRSHVICKIAENWQANLIVMRQPDRSTLDEMLTGGVSNYVVHHAPCAVLTVH